MAQNLEVDVSKVENEIAKVEIEEQKKDSGVSASDKKVEIFEFEKLLAAFHVCVESALQLEYQEKDLLGKWPHYADAELNFTDELECFKKRRIQKLGAGFNLFLLRDTDANFTNVVEYLRFALTKVRELAKSAWVIMREPSEKVECGGRSVPRPDSLGYPWEEKVRRGLTVRGEEVNFGTNFATEMSNIEGLRKGHVFEPWERVMLDSGEMELCIERTTGDRDALAYRLGNFVDNPIDEFSLATPVFGELMNRWVEPLRTSECLRRVPLNVMMRIEAITRFSVPKIEMIPMNLRSMTTAAGTSTSRLNVINEAISAEATERAERDARMLVLAYQSMGYFDIAIDFDGHEEKDELAALACFLWKMMLSYSEAGTERMIERQSAREVDSIIRGFLRRKTENPVAGQTNRDYPLNGIGIQTGGRDIVVPMRTTPRGGGWLHCPRVNSYNPCIRAPYTGLEMPPNLLGLGFNENDFFENISERLERWDLLQAVIDVMNKLRGPLFTGWKEYFQMIGKRIMIFMFRMNEFNSRAYANDFRFDNADLLDYVFARDKKNWARPRIIVKWDSVFYLARAFPQTRLFRVRSPLEMISTARKAEREMELMSWAWTFYRAQGQLIGLEKEISRTRSFREVLSCLGDEITVLKPMFDLVLKSSSVSRMSPTEFRGFPFRSILEERSMAKAERAWVENPEIFGVAPSFYFTRRWLMPEGNVWRQLDVDGKYWSDDVDPENVLELNVAQIMRMGTAGEFISEVRRALKDGRDVELNLPVAFRTDVGAPSEDNQMGMKVAIDKFGRASISELLTTSVLTKRIWFFDEKERQTDDWFAEKLPFDCRNIVRVKSNQLVKSMKDDLMPQFLMGVIFASGANVIRNPY